MLRRPKGRGRGVFASSVVGGSCVLPEYVFVADLPSGTVTFLFSDVEGSTQLLERDAAQAGLALARHHDIFERAVASHGGAIFETVGDAVYAAFARPSDAVATAVDVQRALAAEDWGPIGRLAVRIGIHAGQVQRRGDHYFGPALFRAARLLSLGWGEQTLLSEVAATLVAHALPAGADLRDLGVHRLKDLGEPERVFQLVHPELRGTLPPLKSLDPGLHNLPVLASSFVGREHEIEEVSRLLAAQRLVTLTGAGGMGKTRLSLQVAAEVLDTFPDGVTFVDVAPVRDPALVLPAVAAALGISERQGEPLDSTLAHYLAARHQLLVLDNLEQVLPDAARDVANLLALAPGLRVLATSRAPLHLRGEQQYPVPGLDAATGLFVQRAAEVGAQLATDSSASGVIAEICEHLDGIPLAIELAASRLRVFGLDELRQRLVGDRRSVALLRGGGLDAPARQRTMTVTIGWSVDLLSAEEADAFRRLAVFGGPFELAAAEAVLADAVGDPVGTVEALVDHALVIAAESPAGWRLRMLEPIRQHAEAQLASASELDAARAAHASWIAGMTEAAEAAFLGPQHGAAFDRIASYADDVRAALRWTFDQPDPSVGLRIAIAMGRYWDERDSAEGVDWLERAVSLPPVDGATRLQLVRALGRVHARRGEIDAARADFEAVLRLGEQLGSHDAVAGALGNLAFVSLIRGRLADARRYLVELAARDRQDPAWSRAIEAREWGRLEAECGNFEAASEHFQQSEASALESGDRGVLSATLHDRGMAAMWAGDLPAAWAHAAEAARLAREVGFKGVLAPALTHQAVIAARQGELQISREALGQALDEFEALGGIEFFEDLFDAAAWVALASRQPVAAATLLGAASARWDLIEREARPTDREWHASLVDEIRASAGPDWTDAEAAGANMSPWQAVRLARDLLVSRFDDQWR